MLVQTAGASVKNVKMTVWRYFASNIIRSDLVFVASTFVPSTRKVLLFVGYAVVIS